MVMVITAVTERQRAVKYLATLRYEEWQGEWVSVSRSLLDVRSCTYDSAPCELYLSLFVSLLALTLTFTFTISLSLTLTLTLGPPVVKLFVSPRARELPSFIGEEVISEQFRLIPLQEVR